jgi:hypothetical protein
MTSGASSRTNMGLEKCTWQVSKEDIDIGSVNRLNCVNHGALIGVVM